MSKIVIVYKKGFPKGEYFITEDFEWQFPKNRIMIDGKSYDLDNIKELTINGNRFI